MIFKDFPRYCYGIDLALSCLAGSQAQSRQIILFLLPSHSCDQFYSQMCHRLRLEQTGSWPRGALVCRCAGRCWESRAFEKKGWEALDEILILQLFVGWERFMTETDKREINKKHVAALLCPFQSAEVLWGCRAKHDASSLSVLEGAGNRWVSMSWDTLCFLTF